jgi:molecular chaperone DnaK
MLLTDARQAVADQAPLDRTRELTAELQGVLSGLRAASGTGAGTNGGATAGPRDDAGPVDTGADDDVIDAEFHRG